MRKLANLALEYSQKFLSAKRESISPFIFYKIIDLSKKGKEFTLTGINTGSTFNLILDEIVYDVEILHALHPIQACYIGIEYSKNIDKKTPNTTFQEKQKEKIKEKINSTFTSRYGIYDLQHQDRKGNIYFLNKKNNQTEIMSPLEIAFSKELIQHFDASQAFHIGLLAGIQMNKKRTSNFFRKAPILKIVK